MPSSAADVLVQYGISMEIAHAYVLGLANTDPHALLAVCEQYGITNAMLGEIAGYPGEAYSAALVVSFFASWDIDSSALDPVVPPAAITVTAASDCTVTEGGMVVLQYDLSGTTTEATELAFTLGGTASLSDFDSVQFSSGVSVVDASHIRVEPGQQSVTVLMHSHDDTSVEGTETFSITLGGKTGVGTINDNDTQPPPATGEAFIPSELESLADVLQLNDASGVLSTESLRADIIAHSNEADYWALFDVSGYAGADDGFFTNAETGWTLGTLATDAHTMESLFFGTMVHALKSIDVQEAAAIGSFLQGAGDLDEADFAQLVSLLNDTFSDTPSVSFLSDADIHTAIVEVGVGLVAVVNEDPSIFGGLINWAV